MHCQASVNNIEIVNDAMDAIAMGNFPLWKLAFLVQILKLNIS